MALYKLLIIIAIISMPNVSERHFPEYHVAECKLAECNFAKRGLQLGLEVRTRVENVVRVRVMIGV
jgi:hypothetical protein